MSSSTLTTLLDLPPELIAYILVLSCADLTQAINQTNSKRYQHLKNYSLISHQFVWPAQSELWKNVELYSQIRAKQFLTIALPLPTQQLCLSGIKGSLGRGFEGVTSHVANKIIGTRMMRGLKVLELKDFGKLSAKVLEYKNLSDVKILKLSTSFLPLSNNRFTPPFSLTHLYLYASAGTSPSALIHSLFTHSRNTLKYLNLSLGKGSTAYEGVLSGLESLGTSQVEGEGALVRGAREGGVMEELVLSRRVGGVVEGAAFLGRLKGLKQLKIVRVGFAEDLDGILDGLEAGEEPKGEGGCRLEMVTISIDYNLIATLTTLLEGLSPRGLRPASTVYNVLENLKMIKLGGERGNEYGLDIFSDFCAQRGIVVESVENIFV